MIGRCTFTILASPDLMKKGPTAEPESKGLRSLQKFRITPSQNINISNNRIESLSGLPRPEIIKTLQASNNDITKIEESPLQHCKSMVTLDLSYNHVQKIENLFYLNHLHNLNLAHNVITVIENLEGLVSLRQLNLSDNGIHAIFVRSPLPKLVVLDLSGNKLRRLGGLNVFPCLSTLRLDRCLLTSLSGLDKLLNLRRISASDNAIANFQPFYLPLLSHIDICRNRLTSLSGFSHFQSLVRLDISGNPLDDDGLGINCCFPELKEFKADNTKISDPSLIASIAPNIVVISLTFCKIDSISNIKLLLSSARDLLSLDMRGNPVNSQCYPDLEGHSISDSLHEYESEDQYNLEHPEGAKARKDYRAAVLKGIGSKLAWLDGIRIPGNSDRSVPSPSKMDFKFVDEVPTDDTSVTTASEVTQIDYDEQQEQCVQCNLSTSLLSEDDDESAYHDQCLQTEKHRANYQYPKGLKDSESDDANDDGLRKYVELTDDEDLDASLPGASEPEHLDAGSDDADSASFISHNMDFRPGFSDDEDDDSFSRISAGTDLSSDAFPVFDSPKKERRRGPGRSRCVITDDGMTRNRGGVSFWVSMPGGHNPIPRTVQSRPPTKNTRNNIAPFRTKPPGVRSEASSEASSGDTGHWPFNARTERRLPWDTAKQTSAKPNPVRGPHRPRK